MPQPRKVEDLPVNGKYTVVGASASFFPPSGGAPVLALHHRVVELDENEARRLVALQAVRAATEQDIAHESVVAAREEANRLVAGEAGPSENPYGGKALQSLEEHAAQEIDRARRAAAGK